MLKPDIEILIRTDDGGFKYMPIFMDNVYQRTGRDGMGDSPFH